MNCPSIKDPSLPVAFQAWVRLLGREWLFVVDLHGTLLRGWRSLCLQGESARGKRTARGERERVVYDRRRDIACFGWLVVQTWRLAAHTGDFLSCQLCRQLRCSPYLLCHFAPTFFFSLLFPRGVLTKLCMLDTLPGLERRRPRPAPTISAELEDFRTSDNVGAR